MKTVKTLTLLTICLASIALADDFKTVNGKEYKDATITRIEPDGIVLKYKSGVSKVYFTELPKEVQESFHYAPAKAAQFNAAERAAIAELNAKEQQDADAKAKAAKAQLEKARWEGQARQAAQAQAWEGYRVGPMQSIGGGGNLPQ
jgi:hypothetical protein